MSSAPDVSNLEALTAEREQDEEYFSTASWPEPIAMDGYHGLAGDLVRAIEPHTESDPAAILVQFLAGFGSVVGHDPHFAVESDRHPMNLFVAPVGPSAKARKGTSWGHVKRVLTEADPSWAVMSGLSSGEGLTYAVRDPVLKMKPWSKDDGDAAEPKTVVVDEGVNDKRLLVVEAEFASTLRVLARDGNTLSAVIRNAWDHGDLRSMTKNNAIAATGAHISIIGHITKTELLRYFSATDASNGFGNRFLWLAVRRSKVLPEGGALKHAELKPLIERVVEAATFARNAGLLRRTPLTSKVWAAIYPELSEGKPGLFGSMIMRAEAQVMRLASIYALLDHSTSVRTVHLFAALAVWDYAEESARYIFGDSLGDPVAERILMAARAAPLGLSRTEIRDLFDRNKEAKEIRRALERLSDLGLLHRSQEQTAGRPSERWVSSSVANAENDKDDQRGVGPTFGRTGRFGRTYLTKARAVWEQLTATGEAEGVPVDDQHGAGHHVGNGVSPSTELTF